MAGDMGGTTPYRKLAVEHKGTEKLKDAAGLSSCRNNLFAASRRENLVFIGVHDCIKVYKPSRPHQTLESCPLDEIKCDIPGTFGLFDITAINAIAVGELGPVEVLCSVQDNGDVRVWATNNLHRLIFKTNVCSSAWGIAFHKESRRLAISDNSHTIKVFELGLSDAERSFRRQFITRFEQGGMRGGQISYGGFYATVGFGKDNDKWCLPQDCTLESDADIYHYAWKMVFENQSRVLEGHGHNIPSVSFLNDKSGRWLASAGIDSCFRIWDLQAGSEVAVHEWHDVSYGWGVQFLDPSEFLKVDSLEEALGCEKGSEPHREQIRYTCTVDRRHSEIPAEAFNLNSLKLKDSPFILPTPQSQPQLTATAHHMPSEDELSEDDEYLDYSIHVQEDSESSDLDDYLYSEHDYDHNDMDLDEISYDDSFVSSLIQDLEQQYQTDSEDDSYEEVSEQSETDSEYQSDHSEQSNYAAHLLPVENEAPVEQRDETHGDDEPYETDYELSSEYGDGNEESNQSIQTADLTNPELQGVSYASPDAEMEQYDNSVEMADGEEDEFIEDYEPSDYDTALMQEVMEMQGEEGGGGYNVTVHYPDGTEYQIFTGSGSQNNTIQLQMPQTPLTGHHHMAYPPQTPTHQSPQSSPGSVLDVAGTPLALPPPVPSYTFQLNLFDDAGNHNPALSETSEDESDFSDEVPTEPDYTDNEPPPAPFPQSRTMNAVPAGIPPPAALFGTGSARVSLLQGPDFRLNCIHHSSVQHRMAGVDKMHLVARIPELSLVFVGCHRGQVLGYRLTRFGKQLLYRLDYVLPRQEETVAQVQRGTLVGLTVAPLQGYYEEEDLMGSRKRRVESWRGVQDRRRWRLFLLYSKAVVLSYEIGRKLEDDFSYFAI